MVYSLDSMFTIGDSHTVCEDYAWSGMIQDKFPCIIISDGCSGSDNTDIGARIIVRSLIETLDLLKLELNSHEETYHLINHLLYEKMQRIRKDMGLSISALDATLRMVLIIDGWIFSYNYGDGYTFARNHNSDKFTLEYTKYEYNAPYYFNYTMNNALKGVYVHSFGNHYVDYSGNKISVLDYLDMHHFVAYPLSDLGSGRISISVMSDGVETFFKGNDNFNASGIVDDITSFKNFRGEFVKRKVGKFLSKHAKDNIKHYDDISIATMTFEVVADEE